MLILASALIAAAQPAPVPSSVPAPAKPVKEKKVCRTDTSTGSILPKTVCRTQSQWDDIELANHNVAPLRRELQQTTESPRPQ